VKKIIGVLLFVGFALAQDSVQMNFTPPPVSIQISCSSEFRYFFNTALVGSGVVGSINMPQLGKSQVLGDCSKYFPLVFFKVSDVLRVEFYYVFAKDCFEGNCNYVGWTYRKAFRNANYAPSYRIVGNLLEVRLETKRREILNFAIKILNNDFSDMYYGVVIVLKDGRRLRSYASVPN
jgi:hypothetical protein